MDIKKELENQGLSQKQAEVYLAILELGRATTIEVSEKTSIRRTTAYDIILGLMTMGYVTEAKRGKRRLFIAEDPAALLSKNEQRLMSFKELIPQLIEINSKAVPKPTIKFYDGINNSRMIMEEMLSMKGKVQLFWTSIGDLVDFFGPRYMQSWVKRRIKREITSRVLLSRERSSVPDFYLQVGQECFREMKWLPKNFTFDGILCVFDNKVTYISKQESFGFTITSNEFSSMMRLIFESSWVSIGENYTFKKPS